MLYLSPLLLWLSSSAPVLSLRANRLAQLIVVVALSGPLVVAQSPVFGQCGGIGWTGATTCAVGTVCVELNEFFSQCLPATTTTPPPAPSPTVHLSNGIFQGVSTNSRDEFLGIPFATAARFDLPQPPATATVLQAATAFGPACPQQSMVIPTPTDCPTSIAPQVTTGLTTRDMLMTSEDCLFVNVIRPSNIPNNVTLPVLFWIFGGAFEIGDTSLYNGSTIVNHGIVINEPIIYVSANYRLNAFGFLGGTEVQAAGVGNLGLRDQRFALQWVHDNIGSFGGDASKVIIMGQSAGAISVGLHLFVNSGNPAGLFRGAFMESGTPLPIRDISSGQPIYDQLVSFTKCGPAPDNFTCLRDLDLKTLQTAVNEILPVASYKSLNLGWKPYVDGVFLTQNPLDVVQNGGPYAKVPLIAGNCDDEGTVFSLEQLNLTYASFSFADFTVLITGDARTDAEAVAYLHSNYVPGASNTTFQPIADFYPSNPAEGSPFDTGSEYNITPQYKRIAAVQGDLYFQAPRRYFLSMASQTQNTWSYLYKRNKNEVPCLGSFHGSGLPEWYGGDGSTFEGTNALLNFVNNLDPNKGPGLLGINWLSYSSMDSGGPSLFTFLPAEDEIDVAITPDTYRTDGIGYFPSLFPFYV